MGVADDKYLKQTLFQRPDRLHDPLYVVTPIFNSPRYRTRWKLYEDFVDMCEAAHTKLYTIEVAFGDRDWAVTNADNPQHIQLRTTDEMWYKENAINLAVQRLPQNWKYVAWVDADVHFARNDWANETLHRLQHYDFVQMWSEMHDLDSNHELVGKNVSFASVWAKGGPRYDTACDYEYGRRGYPGAPGLAWACTRRAWNAVGGLIDWAILGACDWFMAHALVGELTKVMKPAYTEGYTLPMFNWQDRAERLIRRNLGVVPGVALHFWHGPKTMRRYATRDQILICNGFDPSQHLKRDWQGLYAWEDDVPIELRDGVRQYFAERQEDHLSGGPTD